MQKAEALPLHEEVQEDERQERESRLSRGGVFLIDNCRDGDASLQRELLSPAYGN
jgi:hypothetical protein